MNFCEGKLGTCEENLCVVAVKHVDLLECLNKKFTNSSFFSENHGVLLIKLCSNEKAQIYLK